MIVGSLLIEMAANVAKLQADMDASKRSVTSAMDSIKGSVAMAQKAFVALAGVASVVAFKNIVDGALSAAESLRSLAIQGGMTVEQLSALTAVGRDTGTSAATIAAASNRLSKALASQNEDSAGAARALKALGLSFDDFQKLAPDERMQTLAKAFDRFQDGGQKSAAAMMLMGRSGAELLPYMQDLARTGALTAETTTAQAEAADRYMDVQGQLAFQTNAWKKSLAMELLPTLLQLSELMLASKNSTAGLGAVLGEYLAEAMKAIAVLGLNVAYVLTQVGNEIGGITAQVGALLRLDFAGFSAISRAMKEDADRARTEVDKLSQDILLGLTSKAGAGRGSVNPPLLGEIKPLITGLGGDPKGARGSNAVDNSAVALLAQLTKEYANLSAAGSKLAEVQEQLKAKGSSFTDEQRRQAVALANMIDAYRNAQREMTAQNVALEAESAARSAVEGAVEDQAQSLMALSKGLEDQRALVGLTSAEAERVTLQRRLAADQLKLEAVVLQAVNAQLMTQAEANKVLADSIKQANDAQRSQLELQQAQERIRTNPQAGINQALKDYADKVRRSGDAWKDFSTSAIDGLEDRMADFFSKGKADWRGYFASIAQEALRLNVIRPMMGQLFAPGGGVGLLGGVLRGALGAMSGGGGVGGTYGPDNIDVGGGWSPAGFANGGRPPVGVPSWVGERGPELFIPDASGTIVPNGGTGKSITLTSVVNVDARSDRAEVYSNVGRAIQENNKRFAEQLRAQGVIQ